MPVARGVDGQPVRARRGQRRRRRSRPSPACATSLSRFSVARRRAPAAAGPRTSRAVKALSRPTVCPGHRPQAGQSRRAHGRRRDRRARALARRGHRGRRRPDSGPRARSRRNGVLPGLVSRVVRRTRDGADAHARQRARRRGAGGRRRRRASARGRPADRAASGRSAPPGWIVGRSVHRGEALDAIRRPTTCCSGPSSAAGRSRPTRRWQGSEALRAAVGCVRPCRWWPSAGSRPTARAACLAAGAAGVAAIGVFLPEGRAPGALGAARAVRELRAAMDATRRQG